MRLHTSCVIDWTSFEGENPYRALGDRPQHKDYGLKVADRRGRRLGGLTDVGV